MTGGSLTEGFSAEPKGFCLSPSGLLCTNEQVPLHKAGLRNLWQDHASSVCGSCTRRWHVSASPILTLLRSCVHACPPFARGLLGTFRPACLCLAAGPRCASSFFRCAAKYWPHTSPACAACASCLRIHPETMELAGYYMRQGS